MTDTRVIKIIKKHTRDATGTLLYATLFGSHLYGNATKESDLDIKVLFLPFTQRPSDEVLLRGDYAKSFRVFYTEDYQQIPNDSSEIHDAYCEIEFWSLQEWLTRLVRRGDTGGIDVLFSRRYDDAILYNSMLLDTIFYSPLRCFNPSDSRAFLGYAVQQAKVYGIKGIRLNVLFDIQDTIRHIKYHSSTRLEEFIDVILEKNAHDMYCRVSPEKHLEYRVLEVLGRKHQGSIYVTTFVERIDKLIREYGHRARKAAETKGKDWKALSHAHRVIHEFIELLTDGIVTFPLKDDIKKVMVRIRNGELSLEEVHSLISQGLEDGDYLRSHTTINGMYDLEFVHSEILDLYNSVLE